MSSTSSTLIPAVLAKIYNAAGASIPANIFSVVCTGGGSQFVSWLFSKPGASRCVIDVQIPYAPVALDDYLTHAHPSKTTTRAGTYYGSKSAQFKCTENTAIRMALTAEQRTLHRREETY